MCEATRSRIVFRAAATRQTSSFDFTDVDFCFGILNSVENVLCMFLWNSVAKNNKNTHTLKTSVNKLNDPAGKNNEV